MRSEERCKLTMQKLFKFFLIVFLVISFAPEHAQSVQLSKHQFVEIERFFKDLEEGAYEVHEKLIQILNKSEDAALTTEIIAGSLVVLGVVVSIIVTCCCPPQRPIAGTLYGNGVLLQRVTVDQE